jgi:hypothetical protein
MRRTRRFTFVAASTLCIQLASVVVAAVGACCPSDRGRQTSTNSAGCTMHAGAQAGLAAHGPGDHSASHATAIPSSGRAAQLTCDCARAGHLVVSGPGLLPLPSALAAVDDVVAVAADWRQAIIEHVSPPFFPPPRPTSLPTF